MKRVETWDVDRRPTQEITVMAPELLAQHLRDAANGVVVVDVRDRVHVAERGTIRDARMFPLAHLGQRIDELRLLRDRTVIVVSSSGRSAGIAAAVLRVAGFEDVRVLEGGFDAWRRLGLPVEPDRRSGGCCRRR